MNYDARNHELKIHKCMFKFKFVSKYIYIPKLTLRFFMNELLLHYVHFSYKL